MHVGAAASRGAGRSRRARSGDRDGPSSRSSRRAPARRWQALASAGYARQRKRLRSTAPARLPRRARACSATPPGSTRTRTSARTTPTGARRPRRRSSAASTRPATSARCVFAMHEPDGYRAANDAVLAARAASGGRLSPLARVAPTPRARSTRPSAASRPARAGSSCTRAPTPSALPHPVVEQVVALAHERARARALPRRPRHPAPRRGGRRPRAPLPRRAADPRPRRDQRPRLDRRRAPPSCPTCSSTPRGGTSPTSSSCYATIPPGQILYASDMPYGPGRSPRFIFLRVARAVGLDRRARLRAIAGGQLARVVAGEDPLDLGPAPGAARRRRAGDRGRARRRLLRDRAAGRLPRHRPGRADRAGSRCACRTCRDGDAAGCSTYVDRLLEIAQESRRRRARRAARASMPGALLALTARGHAGGRRADRRL